MKTNSILKQLQYSFKTFFFFFFSIKQAHVEGLVSLAELTGNHTKTSGENSKEK